MNDLIPICELQGINGCDGRALHKFLEVGRDFSNWIKARIDKYGFVEGEDFIVFSGGSFDSPELANQNSRGGDRRSIEYHLSLDMAKELAMVENNAKGREIRRYFIACEKQLKALQVEYGAQLAKGLQSLQQQVADMQSKYGQLADQLRVFSVSSTPPLGRPVPIKGLIDKIWPTVPDKQRHRIFSQICLNLQQCGRGPIQASEALNSEFCMFEADLGLAIPIILLAAKFYVEDQMQPLFANQPEETHRRERRPGPRRRKSRVKKKNG